MWRSRSGRALWVEIEDDGRGIPAGAPLGVGTLSMRERAEELGGWIEINILFSARNAGAGDASDVTERGATTERIRVSDRR